MAGLLFAIAFGASDPSLADVEARLREGDPHGALALIESLVTAAPGDLSLLEARGRVWQAAGREAELRRQLRVESEVRPHDPRPPYLLAHLAGSPEAKKAFFDAALGRDPDFYPAHFGLARVHLDEHRLGDAHRALDRARFLAPDAPEGFHLAGVLELRRKHNAAALATIGRGLRRWPDDPQLRTLEIEALLLAGDLPRAQASWERGGELWRRNLPVESARLACELAWRRRDAAALGEALTEWPAWDSSPKRVRYQGILAYLREDLDGLEAAVAKTSELDTELPALAAALSSAHARRRARWTFSLALAFVLVVLAALLVGGVVRIPSTRRKSP